MSSGGAPPLRAPRSLFAFRVLVVARFARLFEGSILRALRARRAGRNRFAIAPSAALAFLALALGARAEDAKPDSCVECHREQEEREARPVRLLREGDVHAQAGFSCADCHGGDPTAGVESGTMADAMDPKKGYLGVPKGLGVAAMCGRCHSDIELMRRFNPRAPTDQEAQYRTSVHGKRAAQGDPNVATCASCHGAHGVRRVKDPASPVHPMQVVATCARCHADPERMRPYGIPWDQLEKYRTSVHGRKRLVERDPGAPACNTCHGNHGAVPPGIAAVPHVCGKCHTTQAELFEASAHAKCFETLKAPHCTQCHGNHDVEPASDRMLESGGERGTCGACHVPGDKCDLAAHAMHDGIEALNADIAAAEAKLVEAERKGMDVSKARFDLSGAQDALVRARVIVHAFSRERFEETIREGRDAAAAVSAAGEAALAEHRYRRKGLAISAACLLAFAGLLALKAKRLEREN
jgi:hypothetical protein